MAGRQAPACITVMRLSKNATNIANYCRRWGTYCVWTLLNFRLRPVAPQKSTVQQSKQKATPVWNTVGNVPPVWNNAWQQKGTSEWTSCFRKSKPAGPDAIVKLDHAFAHATLALVTIKKRCVPDCTPPNRKGHDPSTLGCPLFTHQSRRVGIQSTC